MRGFTLLVSLLTFAVWSTSASHSGSMFVRRNDPVPATSTSVSHGSFVFEAGTPPAGVDANLYNRIAQRAWDLIIEQGLGSTDVLFAIKHSDEFADKMSPELIDDVRNMAQRAVWEAKKQQAAETKKQHDAEAKKRWSSESEEQPPDENDKQKSTGEKEQQSAAAEEEEGIQSAEEKEEQSAEEKEEQSAEEKEEQTPEAEKQHNGHKKRSSSYTLKDADADDEPFMEPHPDEQQYLALIHGVEEAINEAFQEERISRNKYEKLYSRAQRLFNLERGTRSEMLEAYRKCAKVCAELHAELRGD